MEKFHLEGYLNRDLTEPRYERANTRDQNKISFRWLVCARRLVRSN